MNDALPNKERHKQVLCKGSLIKETIGAVGVIG